MVTLVRPTSIRSSTCIIHLRAGAILWWRRDYFDELCVDTRVPDLKLLTGASAILDAAHPDFGARQRFVHDLVQQDVDVILIDLGAGSHYRIWIFSPLQDKGLWSQVPSQPPFRIPIRF